MTASFRGRLLWEWAATAVEEAGFTNRYIVVSPGSMLAPREGWMPFINPHASQGMGTSIAAATAALSHYERLLILLGDMPFVDPVHLLRLAEADGPIFTKHDGNRRGCPAAFPRSSFAELKALRSNEGARHLNLAGARCIPPPDPAMLVDLDTAQDFERHSA